MKINKISPLERDFTEVLSTIALKPKTLYYYGKMPENVSLTGDLRAEKGSSFAKNSGFEGLSETKKDSFEAQKGLSEAEKRALGLPGRPKTVAIVGARKNTAYGREVAYKAAYEAARAGAVVVSGLAYGIDSIAHRGALDAGGVTVAVLGTPINKIYPADHRGLAEEIIAKNGTIISEYGPDGSGGHGEAGGTRFLYRNRIIAGLADVVLIVEATERSGSLNTASHALDQGKEVMAVPGDVTRPCSEGCNNLIASGALIYQKPEDLLEVLYPGYIARSHSRRRVAATFSGSPAEKMIVEQLAFGVGDGEEIMVATNMPVSTFNQSISLLEIRGVVKSLGGNLWMLR